MPKGEEPRHFDVIVVGAGVLGASISHWLSSLYDCTILNIDSAQGAAAHQSSRNTGVVHRPFYLDPQKKLVFARTAQASYQLWHDAAKVHGLPWYECGTLNVATSDAQISHLEKYQRWGLENGIMDDELSLLDSRTVSAMEPEVTCRAALFSRTDVSTDFGSLTRLVESVAQQNGVKFQAETTVTSIRRLGSGSLTVSLLSRTGLSSASCGVLVNAAGGGALKIAHSLGLARDLSALNFRGEYWYVDEPFASRLRRNVYTPPKYSEYPFLDPHFVVRSDGTRQVGPNAVLVGGPYSYTGAGLTSIGDALMPPNGPKLRLLSNSTFLSMAAAEWRSSLSKRSMTSRVRRFVPNIRPSMLRRRGVAGVRTSIVGRDGFLPEAELLLTEESVHILNYNSPGATGAPAYSAYIVQKLRNEGVLDGLRQEERKSLWDFDSTIEKAGLS